MKLFAKHKALLITGLLIGVTIVPVLVSAAYSPAPIVFDPNANVEHNSGLGNATPGVVVAGIINWTLGLLVVIALSLVIYAGFLWLLSAGEEEKVTKAKGILTGAFFGILIILASYGMTNYVFGNLLNATS